MMYIISDNKENKRICWKIELFKLNNIKKVVEKLTHFLYEFRAFRTSLTVVSLKGSILWDIAPCSPFINQCFGGTYQP
jgi:hypothetical protein